MMHTVRYSSPYLIITFAKIVVDANLEMSNAVCIVQKFTSLPK